MDENKTLDEKLVFRSRERADQCRSKTQNLVCCLILNYNLKLLFEGMLYIYSLLSSVSLYIKSLILAPLVTAKSLVSF